MISKTLEALSTVPMPERRVLVLDTFNLCKDRDVAAIAKHAKETVKGIGAKGAQELVTKVAMFLAEVTKGE